jgi:hypothetical protein
MKNIWLARDKKNGGLWGYIGKPVRLEDYFSVCEGGGIFYMPDEFPEITWENSPVEYTQKIEAQ